MSAWVLALGWGVVAAIPLVRRARRREVAARAIALRSGAAPAFPTARGAFRLRDRLARLALGPPGRVVAGIVARRRDRRQASKLGAEVPVTLDLLGVAVGAGCTPFLAVEVAAHWAPPTIAARLAAVPRACGLGSSFAAALDDVAAAHPRLRPLADALLASDRLGAPVGPALARLAAEERAALRRRAEAEARTVPVRLLFPLVFLVLPAFGLLTVVPTLVTTLGRT